MLFKPTFWLKSVLQIDEKFLTENRCCLSRVCVTF